MRQIERRSFLSSTGTLLGGALIAGQESHAQSHGPSASGAMHNHVHTVSVMTETANRLLASLTSEQKAKVALPIRGRRTQETGTTFRASARASRCAK